MITGQLPPLLQILEEVDGLWRRSLQTETPFFRSGGPDVEQSATAGREMLRLYHHEQKGKPPPLLVESSKSISPARVSSNTVTSTVWLPYPVRLWCWDGCCTRRFCTCTRNR